MADFVARTLTEWGLTPVFAYHVPYSQAPELSVPVGSLGRRGPGARRSDARAPFEAHELGCWLPELEYTHYLPTPHWRALMGSCAFHVAVTGNCLAALPYARTGRRFLAWVASSWRGDRRAREQAMRGARRILDTALVRRLTPRTEREILARGTILALSEHTRRELVALGAAADTGILPMPVELDTGRAVPRTPVPGRVGFAGRFTDPRKNVRLLIRAVSLCRAQGVNVTLDLIGAEPDAALVAFTEAIGLSPHVNFIPYLDDHALGAKLRALEVFVVPSQQEGLCIAALEAMAYGCPVISTRCGGPEEFVRHGETGLLVDDDPGALADAMLRLVSDAPLARRLADAGRALVAERNAIGIAKERLREAFLRTFPQALPARPAAHDYAGGSIRNAAGAAVH